MVGAVQIHTIPAAREKDLGPHSIRALMCEKVRALIYMKEVRQ